MPDPLQWSGKTEDLPKRLDMFDFREKTYFWDYCSCPCGRPSGFTSDGKMSHSMTIRLRGFDQGFAISNVLVKFYGVMELADMEESGETIPKLFMQTLKELMPEDGINFGLMIRKKINLDDLLDALEEAQKMRKIAKLASDRSRSGYYHDKLDS